MPKGGFGNLIALPLQFASSMRISRDCWDGNDLLGVASRQVLGWNDNGWDVYMLYGPKAWWMGDLPPAPDFSMNQDAEPGLRLDASVFGARVKQLLRN